MNDKRIALNTSVQLPVGKNKMICIKEEIGRGANCIVYNATSTDSIGLEHRVLIKECYPNYLILKRTVEGTIIADFSDKEKFKKAKENFMNAYKRNAELRHISGIINSTINSTDLLDFNNTFYAIMSFDEGMSYSHYKDKSLKELFEHICSLSKLIKKYHERNYLHLDIKPENILIIPETKEHILLFDFDSVVTASELKNNIELRLAFTEGFSAPEQIQGKISKIGKHTDIYSLGALGFYKLFNRKPELEDCKISATYDFRQMNYKDERYQPKLYRKLTQFFRKSLSISTLSRWSHIQSLIDALEELILLSDIHRTYLYDAFQYNSSCFIGRYEEIAYIHELLQEQQIVFISGIGGIGKTELSKKYAQTYRDYYDTVVFIRFTTSLQNLICDEIMINEIEKDENENQKEYFKRKLTVLKKIVSSRDLIIIDNFDIEADENLEVLFECPCKFMITTREDFRDYNYPQITIHQIEDTEEVMQLFKVYNDYEYTKEEMKALYQIFNLVDNHTMTVELIAKYLRDIGDSPISLYKALLKKEGITNTKAIHIKQRKDYKLRSESIHMHIRILFDISKFDKEEEEILKSFSLLRGIRITKSKFKEFCNLSKIDYKLEVLIKRGWIEYDNISNKIGLHQIIQDLIYSDLKPTAESCPHIVKTMQFYMNDKSIHYTERQIRQQVFKIFMERLTGNNFDYVKLCIIYETEAKLKEAEIICQHSTEREALDLLQQIYRKQIKVIADCKDMLKSELDLDDYFINQYKKILNLMQKAQYCCKAYSNKPDYLVKEFVTIGLEVENVLTERMGAFETIDRRIPALDAIYFKIIELFDEATEKLSKVNYTLEEKETLYKNLQKFYLDDDYTTLYKNTYFANVEKAYWYQQQIDKLIEKPIEEEIVSISDDITYSMIAMHYEENGDYDKAIDYYEKAYKIEEDLYECTLYSLAKVSQKAGYIDKAIIYLERILELDKENEKKNDMCYQYTSYACYHLIQLLIENQQIEKAKNYAHELIVYNKAYVTKINDAYHLSYILAGYYILFELEIAVQNKNKLWKQCLKYYKKLGHYTIDNHLYRFIYFYVKGLDKSIESFQEIMDILNRIQNWQGQQIKSDIFNYVISICQDNSSYSLWHLIFLIEYAKYLGDYTINAYQKGLDCCKLAQECYNQYAIENQYYKNLIYKLTADYMAHIESYSDEEVDAVKKKCNYLLLTEEEIKREHYDKEKQIELWKETAEAYRSINNYKKENLCIKIALKLTLSTFNIEESNNYNDYWHLTGEYIMSYINLKRYEEAYQAIVSLYTCTLSYLEKNAVKEIKHEVWRLETLARYLDLINKFEEAIHIYIIAIYFLIYNQSYLETVREIDLQKKPIKWIKKIEIALNKGIDEDLVDTVVHLKEYVYNVLNKIDNASIYENLVQIISKKYQHYDIEFRKK